MSSICDIREEERMGNSAILAAESAPEGYSLPRPLSRRFRNKGKEKRCGDKPTVPHLDSSDLRSRINRFR